MTGSFPHWSLKHLLDIHGKAVVSADKFKFRIVYSIHLIQDVMMDAYAHGQTADIDFYFCLCNIYNNMLCTYINGI